VSPTRVRSEEELVRRKWFLWMMLVLLVALALGGLCWVLLTGYAAGNE
jgi:hypothetical protein